MSLRTRVVTAALGASLLATVGASSPALAQSCPNKRVTTTATYTYERGCIRSFDGTPIVYNLFEPLNPAPGSVYTILEGPGWGGPGATTPDGNLIAKGYAELTWDPRGFGQSGGVAEVDSPAAEGRDASSLITQVLAGRPEIAVDTGGKHGQPHYANDAPHANTEGQPVVGMAGGSYGGGIQWSTASFDDRVKAIVPALSWNDLDYSLAPGGVIKLGWDELLFAAGLGEGAATHLEADLQALPTGGDGGNQTGGLAAMLYQAETEGLVFGYWPRATTAWFHQRSIAEYGAGSQGHVPHVPALLLQGTVDTLFNLTDAWTTVQEVRAHDAGVPLKLIAFCGGHVSCPTGAAPTGEDYSDTASKSSPVAPGQSAGAYTEAATLAWFDHYLRGEGKDDGMPADVVYQDQHGDFHPLATFPTPDQPGPATYVTSPAFGGTIVTDPAPTGALGAPLGVDTVVTDGATPAGDPGQVTVPVLTAGKQAVPVVGIGRVKATVTVNGTAAELFFRLIDKDTGKVVDLQTAPLRLDNLDLAENATNAHPPAPQEISVDLPGVAYDLPAGDTLELQVSTSTNSYVPNRGVAAVTLEKGTVAVPTLGS